LKSNPQKLLFATYASFPGTSGDSSHHLEMIMEFKRKGLDVFLVCPWHVESRIFDQKMRRLGIKVVRIPLMPPTILDFVSSGFVRNLIRVFSYYIVECFTVLLVLTKERIRDHVIVRCVLLTLPLAFVLKILRIDGMAEFAELPIGTYIPNLGTGVKGVLLMLEAKVLHSCSRFRVMVNEQLEYLVKLGIPKEKIIVSFPGINLSKMPAQAKLSSLPPATFGYFGLLEAWNGVDNLIKAFSIVSSTFRNSKLYLIGTGTMKTSLKQLAEELGLSGNVLFVDPMEREILWREYFPKFRIVVLPRPKTASSSLVPMKLIESLAAGKVVITTPIKSIEYIIKSCAIIVPSSDPESLATAMLKIIDNQDLQMELSQKSVVVASLFNIDKVADAILNAFNK
jgi:glycosyltransferase involved in cell wall biosynthesis